MRDPYTTLSIPPGADDQTVRRAYKKLAVEFHPDRNRDPAAADRFKEVVEAYAVLTDQHARQRYLRRRRREHAEREQRSRQQAAEARRRTEAERSKAAYAAGEAFRAYASQVRRRREERAAGATQVRSQAGSPTVKPPTNRGFGRDTTASVLLMATYLWRSALGLPLQPWLSAESFATHSLTSPIWITLWLALLMIVRPRWFLIPILIDGARDVRLAGWAMLLMFPLIAAARHLDRLIS